MPVTPITVTKGAPQPTPAADGSPLFNFRARRIEKLNKLHLDLKVPRWHENGFPAELWVRYRPASVSVAVTASERRQKSKDPADKKEWALLSNIDILVDSCVGVYAKGVADGQPYTLDTTGEWVGFDPDTATDAEWVSVAGSRVDELNEAFGFDDARRAVDTMRRLFFSEGDLMGHVFKLSDWSGVTITAADEEAVGE